MVIFYPKRLNIARSLFVIFWIIEVAKRAKIVERDETHTDMGEKIGEAVAFLFCQAFETRKGGTPIEAAEGFVSVGTFRDARIRFRCDRIEQSLEIFGGEKGGVHAQNGDQIVRKQLESGDKTDKRRGIFKSRRILQKIGIEVEFLTIFAAYVDGFEVGIEAGDLVLCERGMAIERKKRFVFSHPGASAPGEDHKRKVREFQSSLGSVILPVTALAAATAELAR